MSRHLSLLALFLAVPAWAQDEDFTKNAQGFRQGKPVSPMNETTVIAEAEEFQVSKPGWQAKAFGTNYYAATFANSFLSRKAYLGAPEECDPTEASIEVQVPKAGKYLALVRYEAAYRFETQFTLTVEQGGAKKLDRLYGARDNLRIWAFREKLKKEVAWPWGAVENVVWEGHDAVVDLQAGTAKLTLRAGKQPGLPARRNVDLVMLTSDIAQVNMRIEKENYLPLDGMLTQAGDVFVKVHNKSAEPLTLVIPNGTEHSPYWIHLRDWKALNLPVKPGMASEWNEVGSLLDTLSDGQWNLQVSSKAKGPFDLEFGLKQADGKIVSLKTFSGLSGGVALAYDADTRYSRRVRLQDDILYDLVAYLKKHPLKGTGLKRTLVYGYTFAPKPGDAKYTSALNEFLDLMGATALGKDSPEELKTRDLIRGYIDVRGVPTPKLEEYCKQLQKEKKADKIAVVSLGDEIGLGAPPAKDHEAFRGWLKGRGLKPAEVDPATKGDWEKVFYLPKMDKGRPEISYFSKLYAYHYGIQQLRERTNILKTYLPHAGIGANFSPHHGALYLGETHHWISLFREGGMTMPWGEDYIWQVPVGSLQMNTIMVDMFRCAIKPRPEAKIHYYVMPHTPGNTPDSWRRQFYGDIAHGVKVFNLFEFRPVQFAYTENHVSSPAMYQEVRKSLHELAGFEDIVQEAQVTGTDTAIWCSDTADIYDNHQGPFAAAKRTLYILFKQMNRPLDFVLEGDDLKPYKTLVLCDRNVSKAGSKMIVDFVEQGGQLFATAGAGMLDEFDRPNEILRGLLGVAESKVEVDAALKMEKQDLPFAASLGSFTLPEEGGLRKVPVFGARDHVRPVKDIKGETQTLWRFADEVPGLIVRTSGKGKTVYCSFLPGLTYFHGALPKRPVDRGATDDAHAHFTPTAFHFPLAEAIGFHLTPTKDRILVSDPRVNHTLLRAKSGAAIPLVNWSKGPLKGLRVTVPSTFKLPSGTVTLASGRPVQLEPEGPTLTAILDLDIADALIFRTK